MGANEVGSASTSELVEMTLEASQGSLLGKLERVLLALVARSPDVGYTQGMNYVAAILLFDLEEDDAFWVMCTIIECHFTDFYSADLSGTQVENSVLGKMIQGSMPATFNHLEAMSIPPEIFTTEWVMTLFTKVLPPALTAVVRGQHMRAATAVLDRLLLGHHWAGRPADRDAKCVMARMIVCALDLVEPVLLATDDPSSLMELMRGLPIMIASSLESFLDTVEHKPLIPDAEIRASRLHFKTQHALSKGRRQKVKALRQAFREVSQWPRALSGSSESCCGPMLIFAIRQLHCRQTQMVMAACHAKNFLRIYTPSMAWKWARTRLG